jgi:hypothetical protein
MLRFSLKESAFKALHPVVKRHIPFTDVEVYPKEDGSALIRPLFPLPQPIPAIGSNCHEERHAGCKANKSAEETVCQQGSQIDGWLIRASWKKLTIIYAEEVEGHLNNRDNNANTKNNVVLKLPTSGDEEMGKDDSFWITVVDIKAIPS